MTVNKIVLFFFFQAIVHRLRYATTCMSDIPQGVLMEAPNTLFLPSQRDNWDFRTDIVTILAEILVRKIPICARLFKGLIPDHFTHEHTAEMSMKSEIVSLYIGY